MSGPDFISTVRSTDHDFVAGLRFLDEYAKHLASRSGHSSDVLGHHFVPRFDLEEHEHNYELYGELPGFDRDHIIVEANDDHNIQISGWIPRKHADVAVVLDPSVPVVHRDIPLGKPDSSIERFGEVLNPHRESLSDAPVASHSVAAPAPESTPAAVPHLPHEHRPETARFGDVLDPHANFVHRPKDAKPKVKYLIAERQYGQFHRAFHFPKPIKKEEVQARLENGVLHISAPRKEVEPPMRVEVKKAGGS